VSFDAIAFRTLSLPTAPLLVRGFPLTAHSVHVSWTDETDGAAKYEVSNGSTSQFTKVGATSFDWSGLAPGSNTCFRLRAVTSSGNSEWRPNANDPLCVYTPAADATPPQPPTGLTATSSSSYLIHLSWTDQSGGSARYEISNGTVSMFTVNPSGASNGFDWAGLNPGTRMCFTVRAYKFSGASSWAGGGATCATTPARACQATEDPDTSGEIDFYHGTDGDSAAKIVANGIDLTKGDRWVDFGKGFYVTTDLTQAKRWTKDMKFANPSVVHFRVPLAKLEPGGLCGLVFSTMFPSSGFFATILSMRTFSPPLGGEGYDFVEGPLITNPFDFISGDNAPQTEGQQDSFHTAAGAALLDAGIDKNIIRVP
jgi:hypothetical protein